MDINNIMHTIVMFIIMIVVLGGFGYFFYYVFGIIKDNFKKIKERKENKIENQK